VVCAGNTKSKLLPVEAEALDWCGAGGVVRKVFDAELEYAAALVFRGGDDCYYADRIPSLRAVSSCPIDDEAAVVGLSSMLLYVWQQHCRTAAAASKPTLLTCATTSPANGRL
jgi:hypothetical protein